MAQTTGKRLRKMGYLNVGNIDYHGIPYTIWVGSDPKLAADSWAHQRAHYFSDYTGPDPPGLDDLTRGAKTIKPKPASLF
jgi:hypothetical protein